MEQVLVGLGEMDENASDKLERLGVNVVVELEAGFWLTQQQFLMRVEP